MLNVFSNQSSVGDSTGLIIAIVIIAIVLVIYFNN